MLFHPDKCNVLRITRAQSPVLFDYSLKNQILEAKTQSKYLGVDISSNLSWNRHIDRIVKKGNSMIGFLQRNLRVSNRDTKASSIFDTTASLETHNRFDSLSSLSDPESPIPDIIGPPTAASSPIVQEPKEAKGEAAKAALNHPLRILIMNCQSIKNKMAELHTIIDLAKPDIILGNESWLTPEIENSEIFPGSFDAHGGVFIAFKLDLLCTETPELDTNCYSFTRYIVEQCLLKKTSI